MLYWRSKEGMQAEACVVRSQTIEQGLEYSAGLALQEFGYTRSNQNSCLYFIIEGGQMTFAIVDDFLIFTIDAEVNFY